MTIPITALRKHHLPDAPSAMSVANAAGAALDLGLTAYNLRDAYNFIGDARERGFTPWHYGRGGLGFLLASKRVLDTGRRYFGSKSSYRSSYKRSLPFRHSVLNQGLFRPRYSSRRRFKRKPFRRMRY